MKNISENLRELIDETGKTMRDLAKEIGIDKSSLSDYLNGAIPTIKNLEKLATYFNCSIDYLFGLDEVKKRGTYHHFDISVFLGRYDKVLKENKITHWKFCQEFQLAESNIRKWRKGQNPSAEILVVIAKELSTSIDWLIGRK